MTHSPPPGAGVAVLLLVSLLAGCTAGGASPSRSSGSDAASPGVLTGPTDSGVPAATPSRPSATASASQPPEDMGVVFVAQTLVDAFMGTTITVQLAQTVWVPAVAATPVTPGPVRMTGIRIQVRSDASSEAPAVDGSGFSLIAADGASAAPCAALPTGGADEARSLAVLAGIAGDRSYTFDPATGGGEGWIVCTTTTATNAAFDARGYTVRYDRPETAGSDGIVRPAFSADVPLAPEPGSPTPTEQTSSAA